MWGTTVQSLTLGGVAAAVATALALPVAVLTVRHPSTTSNGVERVAFLDRALPGVAIGLTLVTVAVHHLEPALPDHHAARGGVRHPLLPPRPRGGARRGRAGPAGARGRGPVARARRPSTSCAASRCRWSSPAWPRPRRMVWLSATTELTATLLLRPTGLETLATRFWVYTTGLAYGAAAPYAAIMIGVSVLPVLLLARLARSSSASAGAGEPA